jgi:glucokinase
MVGFTLGTGVGGVFAVDGKVHQGHDGTAGELGHHTIDPNGPMCNCGNRGCLESYARADQIAAACGTATAEDAVRAAADGDPRAVRGLADVGRYLGIGIANMITVVTPDRVVLGGGVAAAGELLFASIRAEIARRVKTTAIDEVEIVPAELGTWAGAIGAAVHGAEAAAAAVELATASSSAASAPATQPREGSMA